MEYNIGGKGGLTYQIDGIGTNLLDVVFVGDGAVSEGIVSVTDEKTETFICDIVFRVHSGWESESMWEMLCAIMQEHLIQLGWGDDILTLSWDMYKCYMVQKSDDFLILPIFSGVQSGYIVVVDPAVNCIRLIQSKTYNSVFTVSCSVMGFPVHIDVVGTEAFVMCANLYVGEFLSNIIRKTEYVNLFLDSSDLYYVLLKDTLLVSAKAIDLYLNNPDLRAAILSIYGKDAARIVSLIKSIEGGNNV